MGKVYLVGAGPGDVGLITMKGIERLKECDAVVYDHLASEELLAYVRADCERIYVGKQAGKHSKKQEEINRLLVECARRYHKVVRLKGGDSFVFGRGGEEIEALQAEKISYEVIPGITSAVAVPECVGIPVTHRGMSRSFHVITGHTRDSKGSPEYDYEVIAKLEGTLVFLMGLSNLGEITARLLQAGKDEMTPVAVIANGTTAEQQVVRGRLAEIAEKVEREKLPSPAVIVIGETAGLHYQETNALMKKAGIVATKALQKKLVSGLERLGIEAVTVCNMELNRTGQLERLRKELLEIEKYCWVLFTSQNAVALFFDELRKCQVDIRRLGKIRFAVLGSGTEEKLKGYGIQADFVPTRYTVAAFAEEFIHVVKEGESVLIPRAVQGSPVLTETLAANRVAFLELAIYDVKGSLTKYGFELEKLSYLLFVSASGVQAFFSLLQEKRICLPETIKVACIGELTEKRLIEYGRKAEIVATINDVGGLLSAIQTYENL